ncbi:MAG: sugar transferase [Firmicutes bacterium]|nr:sugar transferase [Bacillota bacterium]
MYLKVKRFTDIVISLIGLLIFWWVLLIIAVVVMVDDKGNPIFKQRRIGKDKEEFYIYKFRTMKKNTPDNIPSHLLENPELYITKVGKFLRYYSLDELPQLFNILKGDMSLVGPRPALYNQYDLIKERDRYGVNAIKPGLTGYAQVNGRDEVAIKVKARLDGEYVRRMGFLTDIFILLKTVEVVIKGRGVKEGK